MGELRLYAISIEEVRGMFGASPEWAQQLREIATRAFTPAPSSPPPGGLIGKLGPLFRRVPAAPVVSPTAPEPADVEVLLAGGYVPAERLGATWRVLETLVQGSAWGSTKMPLTSTALDDLDFALARGGVSAAVGLRHLLSNPTSVPLLPVPGLTAGWHPHDKALAMAGAYRTAIPMVASAEHRELVGALVTWLDGFIPWANVARSMGRPVPDLVGFWAH